MEKLTSNTRQKGPDRKEGHSVGILNFSDDVRGHFWKREGCSKLRRERQEKEVDDYGVS